MQEIRRGIPLKRFIRERVLIKYQIKKELNDFIYHSKFVSTVWLDEKGEDIVLKF